MTLSQQKFREMVFQILYSYDLGHPNEDLMTELMMAELAISKKNVKSAQDRVQQILSKLSEIDPLIASISTSYEFDRIQTVTKNILRLGIFELLFDSTIPHKVAIAEAMRLARKFSTPESASFVNALMDHVHRTRQGESIDLEKLKTQAQDLQKSEEIAQQKALELKEQQSEQDAE